LRFTTLDIVEGIRLQLDRVEATRAVPLEDVAVPLPRVIAAPSLMEDGYLNVCVLARSSFVETDELLHTIHEIKPNGTCMLKALFARIIFSSMLGGLKDIRIGSAHLQNDEAKKYLEMWTDRFPL
jgi:hypothetical protein